MIFVIVLKQICKYFIVTAAIFILLVFLTTFMALSNFFTWIYEYVYPYYPLFICKNGKNGLKCVISVIYVVESGPHGSYTIHGRAREDLFVIVYHMLTLGGAVSIFQLNINNRLGPPCHWFIFFLTHKPQLYH